MKKILVAGNGVAAASALKKLVASRDAYITIISPGFYPASYKPLFPLISSGKLENYETFLLEPKEYSSQNINFRPGQRIEKLFADKRLALLSTDEEIEFDAAIIATGFRALIPEKFEKAFQECRNIFVLDNLEDALNIKALIEEGAKNLIIVGAGRTGVSLANAFTDRKLNVYLIEKEYQVLPCLIDKDMALPIEEKLQEKGVSILTQTKVEEVIASDRFIESIRLHDGTKVPCHMVIIASGSKANVDLLEGNFTIATGLIVNQNLETQEPGIFAAGDVVQISDFNGKRNIHKLAVNAWLQGEIAARNVTGEKVICPVSFAGKYVEIDGYYVGYIGERVGTDYYNFSFENNFVRFTIEGLRVTGIQFSGIIEKIADLANAGIQKIGSRKIPEEIKYQVTSGFSIFQWHKKFFEF